MHREKGHEKMEAETGVKHLQAKVLPGLPNSTKSQTSGMVEIQFSFSLHKEPTMKTLSLETSVLQNFEL